MQTRVYFSNLDSLRFFAFLAVFIAHAGILFPVSTDWFYQLYRLILSQGAYGVNFFFVLSGFLITYLLLLEKRKNGFVSIRAFYLKRVLRIWPLYYVVMLISIFLLPTFITYIGANYIAGNMKTFPNLGMAVGEHAKIWFTFFVGNFYRGAELGAVPFTLGVLWSVCVEEQFYLFWPWIAKKFSTFGVFMVSFLIFAISLIYKAIHINDANIAYYSTLSVAMDLASGCMMAVLYMHFEREIKNARLFSFQTLQSLWRHFKKMRKKRLEHKTTFKEDGLIILCIILILGTLFYLAQLFMPLSHTETMGLTYDFLRVMKRPVINMIFVGIIFLAIIQSSAKKHKYDLEISEKNQEIEEVSSPIRRIVQKVDSIATRIIAVTNYFGKISYGLYAYHAIVMIVVIGVFNHYGIGPNDVTVSIFSIFFIASFAGTVVLSHYSYQWLEKRFLALKSRLK